MHHTHQERIDTSCYVLVEVLSKERSEKCIEGNREQEENCYSNNLQAIMVRMLAESNSNADDY